MNVERLSADSEHLFRLLLVSVSGASSLAAVSQPCHRLAEPGGYRRTLKDTTERRITYRRTRKEPPGYRWTHRCVGSGP